MKYLSLFSGIGGFELGIYRAYVDTTNRSKNGQSKSHSKKNAQAGTRLVSPPRQEAGAEIGWNRKHHPYWSDAGQPTCVGFSEIDKYAIQVYQNHFSHKNYGDITKINAQSLPDFDFLVGGFPCQSFSIAGKRRGFDDTRGTLFFDIARILEAKRPQFFLLENVKGLLSHDNGSTFKTIIATLTELGYDLQWQVLNSKNFGVPQNRERVFIVGHTRGIPRPEVFPFVGADEEDNESRQVSTTINAGGGGQGAKTGLYMTQRPRGKNKGGNHDLAPTMTGHSYQDNNHVIANTLDANYAKGNSGSSERHTPRTQIESVTGIRRLTPKECERLQGFPDRWTEGISDSQRYKCLGNAVTVNVIQAIMEKINEAG